MHEEAPADLLLREAEDEGVSDVRHIVQRKSRLRKSTRNKERKKSTMRNMMKFLVGKRSTLTTSTAIRSTMEVVSGNLCGWLGNR